MVPAAIQRSTTHVASMLRKNGDGAPIVASSTGCCAMYGLKYEMVRRMWRQVQDGAPNVAPSTR
jgi:hypothetical protein